MGRRVEDAADGRRARRGAGPGTGSGGSADIAPSRARAILVGLVVLAAAARAIGLGGGLWLDEITSLLVSFRRPLAEMLTAYGGENDHPLYSVLAHLSTRVFGESSWSIRLPAALFGVACVPMAYALAREAGMRRVEALATAAIVAVSYHHVWFSQNARGYSATALVALVSTRCLLRGIGGGGDRAFLAAGVAMGLGACIHLTMVFVAIGQALALAWHGLARSRQEARATLVRGAVITFGTAAALTLLFYAPRMARLVDTFDTRTMWVGTSSPWWAIGELLSGLSRAWGGGSGILGPIALAGGTVTLAAGLGAFARERSPLDLLVVLPPVAVVAGSWLVRGVLYPRFLFFAIGPILLAAVRGLFVLSRRLLGGAARAGSGDAFAWAGVVVAVVASLAVLPFDYRYPKQDYVGAARWTQEHAGPGDTVLFAGPGTTVQQWLEVDWPGVCDSFSAILAKSRARGTTWVLWTFPHHLSGICPEILPVLARDCPSPRVFPGTVGGGDVRVCRFDRIEPPPPTVDAP